jgi:hypothetical protein
MAVRDLAVKDFCLGAVTMKTNRIAALAVVPSEPGASCLAPMVMLCLLFVCAGSLRAQDALQFNVPYACNDGATYVVHKCETGPKGEMCFYQAEGESERYNTREAVVSQMTKMCKVKGTASAAAAAGQSPSDLQFNTPYECAGGLSLTISQCQKQNGQESCPVKVEDNGKFLLQVLKPRDEIVTQLKACKAGAPSNPPHRAKSPSAGGAVQSTAAENSKNNITTSASAGTVQRPDSLHENASYQCGAGVSVTVIRCAKQDGREYCEFKMEKDGKATFQGVNLREKVAAGVQACRARAATSLGSPDVFPRTMAEQGKSFDPPYLNDMPSIELVKKEIQGKDATDTLARQVAVFTNLGTVVRSFSLAGNRYDLTPDEAKITGKYSLAAYEMEQNYKKTHTAAEADAFYHLHGHYELMDPALDQEMRAKLFSTAFLQQLASADKTWLQALQAHNEQEKRASEEAANAAKGGSPFIRNDPGTLAARRCVELGGNELKCMEEAFWTGLTDLGGGAIADILHPTGGPHFAGVVMNGWYRGAAGPRLSFGAESVLLDSCGELVPDNHAYTVTKKPNQLLINVQSQPTPIVFSMGSDGRLIGPGSIDVKGRIIVGHQDVYVPPVAGGSDVGHWSSVPIHAPKTERCTIGTLAQVPPPPPDKNPLVGVVREIAASMSNVVTLGPPGLRMTGQYIGQGGFALDFADDAVTLDCGEAHVKQPYTVQNAATQLVITVNNDSTPFTLVLQSNGTLSGSGSMDVVGRVATGGAGVTFAPRNARCAIGTLTPK